jgi:hypothetical protein
VRRNCVATFPSSQYITLLLSTDQPPFGISWCYHCHFVTLPGPPTRCRQLIASTRLRSQRSPECSIMTLNRACGSPVVLRLPLYPTLPNRASRTQEVPTFDSIPTGTADGRLAWWSFREDTPSEGPYLALRSRSIPRSSPWTQCNMLSRIQVHLRRRPGQKQPFMVSQHFESSCSLQQASALPSSVSKSLPRA